MKNYIFHYTKFVETSKGLEKIPYVIPFETNDLIHFVEYYYNELENSEIGFEILGVFFLKENLKTLPNCFQSVEEWHEKNKMTLIVGKS